MAGLSASMKITARVASAARYPWDWLNPCALMEYSEGSVDEESEEVLVAVNSGSLKYVPSCTKARTILPPTGACQWL